MGRPVKEGLDYFSVDVNMDQDEKIFLIEHQCGPTALSILMKLLMHIYKKGYYCDWTDRDMEVFAAMKNLRISDVRNLVSSAINVGFFSGNLYFRYRKLSSRRIQFSFLRGASKRETIKFDADLQLFDVKEVSASTQKKLLLVSEEKTDFSEEETSLSVSETPFFGTESTQRKEKKRKEKNINTKKILTMFFSALRRKTGKEKRASGTDYRRAESLLYEWNDDLELLEKAINIYVNESFWFNSKDGKPLLSFSNFCTNAESVISTIPPETQEEKKKYRTCPVCKKDFSDIVETCPRCEFDYQFKDDNKIIKKHLHQLEERKKEYAALLGSVDFRRKDGIDF